MTDMQMIQQQNAGILPAGAGLLDLRDLTVRFPGTPPVEAVRGVSLSLAPGEVLGLVGESGSGKSMTAMTIAGLTPPAAEVRFSHLSVDGRALEDANPEAWRKLRRDVIGFVFQNPMRALNPRLTVGASLREALPDAERGRVEAYHRSLELMEAVGIDRATDRLRQFPHELSGGLAQRVVIALALARRPKLLIADEPTTALDVSVQAQILDLLEKLRSELGLGVLLVSHDLDVINDRADRVAVMQKGLIVESGPCARVIGAPRHDYTRMLLASAPTHLLAERATTGPAAEPDPVHTRPLAEAVRVTRTFGGGGLRLPWRAAQSRPAVDDVTVSVRPGESLGIVGESGSGKTTLARMLVGLETPDGGNVLYDGQDVAALGRERHEAWRRDVQFVFQDNAAALDPRFTIGESILEPLTARGVAPAERQERLDRVLTEVGLEPGFASRRPHQLSGGQRQRVGIARALISNPKLILADEPVSALDVSVQAVILKLLNRLRAERGMSYVIISHDIGVIRYVCDQVAVMCRGELVEAGPCEEVLTRPRHAYTRALLAAVPGQHAAG